MATAQYFLCNLGIQFIHSFIHSDNLDHIIQMATTINYYPPLRLIPFFGEFLHGITKIILYRYPEVYITYIGDVA